MHKKGLVVGSLVSVLVLSGVVLGTGAVFATQTCTTNDTTGQVTCTNSATASVTVSAACSFSTARGAGYDNEKGYTGTLANNADVEITGSTFTTICNDSGGYAIYAIGYGDSTLGNTDLIFDNDSTSANKITTNGNPGSNTSYWQMKLTAATENQPVLDNGYGSYSAIPSNYTKIASYGSAGAAVGQDVTVSYKAHASSTQPAGTYTGAVKYTMVHPSTNVPDQPRNCTANKICYYPNAGNTVADTMGDQSIGSSDTSATLWASNFQRPGYGFAGWNTEYDGSGTFYGPNETIEFEAGQYDGAGDHSAGLSLYAVWIEPAKDNQGNELTFQTTGLLSKQLSSDASDTLANKSNGYVTALRDQRDGQVYAIAKLADGKYWMIENLRLEAEYTRGSYYQSLAQGYSGAFIGLADPETANFTDSTVANSLYNTTNITGDNQGSRFPRYNNSNTASSIANMTSASANVYSYGNYYTWAAALANTNNYISPTAEVDGKTSETANTSICPSGWRLPYGRNTGNGNTSGGFYYLNYKLNNDTNITDDTASNKLRAYPNNFVYSGDLIASSTVSRGSDGLYWSTTAATTSIAYDLIFGSGSVHPGVSLTHNKNMGASVRCVQGS